MRKKMKAMILAAGRGKRMRHLTDSTAKPLLKLWGKSLIEWQIKSLKSGGFDQLVINIAHYSDHFYEVLGNGERYGVKIEYSEEGSSFEDALETRGGIVKALPLLTDGKEPFVVVSGDVVTDFDYSKLYGTARQMLVSKFLAHLVLVPNPSYKPSGDMSLNRGLVVREPQSYTYGNIAIFYPQIFSKIDLTCSPLFPWLYKFVDSRKVGGELFHGYWANVGTPEDIEFYEKQGSFIDK